MAATLSKEISTFQRLLPTIRKDHGSAWAVVVGEDYKGAFREFSAAAKYVLQNFPQQSVLIRHTDERQAHIPFVAVEDRVDR